MPKKETGDKAAQTASKGLRTGKLTQKEIRKVSGSTLSQQERKDKKK